MIEDYQKSSQENRGDSFASDMAEPDTITNGSGHDDEENERQIELPSRGPEPAASAQTPAAAGQTPAVSIQTPTAENHGQAGGGRNAKRGYQLERDVTGYVIQWEKYRPAPPAQPYLRPVEAPPSDWRFKGQFPDQRVALEYLLHRQGGKSQGDLRHDVIMRRGRNPSALRYVHIPYNNMEVRYFVSKHPVVAEILTDLPCGTVGRGKLQ